MDSAKNIVIHTEYSLKVSTIHIVSDQSNGVEHKTSQNVELPTGLGWTQYTHMLEDSCQVMFKHIKHFVIPCQG